MYLGGQVNVYAADGSGRIVGQIDAPPGVFAIHEGGGAYADEAGVWHDAPAPSGGGGGAPGAAVESGENGEWMDASGQWYTAAGVPFDARARREAGGGGEGGGTPCDDDSPCGGGSCDRCADGSAVCGGRAFDWCRPSGFRSGGGGGGMTSFASSSSIAGVPSWAVYVGVAVAAWLLLRR